MAAGAFTVVTEFVFGTETAILGAKKLNSQVEKLAQTTEDAAKSVASLGLSYIAHFSGATGGILGVLGNAIRSQEKFKATQIELANFMVANKASFMGGAIGFKDAMTQSSFIMDGIITKARNIGISPDQFLDQVKAADAFLRPKGLSGNNMERSTKLARVSMKATDALGVSPMQAQSGIQAGITGQLSANTQFGTRLFIEAGDALKKASGGVITDLKSFNKAKASVRVDAMIAGLEKLAGVSDVVSARAQTVTSKLMQLSSLFTGKGSILKPLGEVLIPLIVETFDILIDFLRTDGAEIVKQLAIFIKHFVDSPKKMILRMMDLKSLVTSLGTGISVTALMVSLAHAREFIEFLQKTKLTRGIGDALGAVGKFFDKIPFIGKYIKRLKDFSVSSFKISGSGFFGVLKSLARAGGRVFALIGAIAIPLQGLFKLFNRQKVDAVGAMAKGIDDFMGTINKVFNSLKRLGMIFDDASEGWSFLFEGIADFVGWVYDQVTTLGGLLSSEEGTGISGWIDDFTKSIWSMYSVIRAVVAGISEMVAMLANGDFKDLYAKSVAAGYVEFYKNQKRGMMPSLGPDGKQGVVGDTITNNKITMNNSFKEVLQPDRIAFTIAEQLRKESSNKRSARPTTAAGTQALGF